MKVSKVGLMLVMFKSVVEDAACTEARLLRLPKPKPAEQKNSVLICNKELAGKSDLWSLLKSGSTSDLVVQQYHLEHKNEKSIRGLIEQLRPLGVWIVSHRLD